MQEPSAYFEQQISKARSSDHLWVVLDPEGYLALGDEFHVAGNIWRVYHYAENDLAFRASYCRRPVDPNFCHVVWVTPAPFRRARPAALGLSFIPDVLRRADRILDLSLAGLLRALVPGEVFPEAGLQTYGSILSRDLPALVAGLGELRREIGPRPPLDISHLRALAIHCLQPAIPVKDVLFTQPGARQVLGHYLRLVWSGRLEGEGLTLLQEQATSSCSAMAGQQATPLQPWFQATPSDLALLIYAYRTLRDFGVANPLNQIRGLGLLAIDPAPLAPYLDVALALWQDKALRTEVARRAEAALEPEQVGDLIGLLPMPDLTAIGQALKRETAPALICGLAERFLSMALRQGILDDLQADQLPSDIAPAEVETTYSDRAQAALLTFRELAFVLDHLRHPFQPLSDLARLADWYAENDAYRLEMAHALADDGAKRLPSAALRQELQPYLDRLLCRIRDYLNQIDTNLADLVERGYDAFLGHPRLSVHVLRDTLLQTDFHPSLERSAWILVFDGLRWDSWREVVLPALTRQFEIVDAGKAYLCLLPSFTSVARTGLLAGGAPPGWRAADGSYTANEAILIARLFDLDPAERDRWLRVEVHSESEVVQRRLGGDFDRRPINVLIYNLSDDWIHRFQGSLADVNRIIAQQMETVVSDLQRHVREGDLMIVTSDHGFVELDPAAGIPVADRQLREQGIEAPPSKHVFYRYLADLEHPSGLRVPFQGDRFFTVARGRTWFQRQEGRPSRYTHGGLSMGEMVVPGLTMRCIVEPFVRLVLAGLPRRLEVVEKEPQAVSLTLTNAGNRAAAYTVVVAANTDAEGKTLSGTLGPHEAHKLSYTFTPAYGPRPTDRLTVQIAYIDVDGGEKRLPARSIAIATKPRTDVVEIDFGGLDQLDQL